MYANRYELKYIVKTKNISKLMESFGKILIPDENNEKNLGYYNHSIYFDTHKLRFYRDKQEGLIQRLKPRIRLYRNATDFEIKSLFLEFKHKNDRTVFKNRSEIDAKTANELLVGFEKSYIDRIESTNKTIRRFYQLSKKYLLRPKVAVNYKRFAYFSELYPKLRVTVDQFLEASLDVSLHARKSSFVNIISPRYTLIEFKYDSKLPKLLLSIIREHELKNVTFSKYSNAMEVAYETARSTQNYKHNLFISAIKG